MREKAGISIFFFFENKQTNNFLVMFFLSRFWLAAEAKGSSSTTSSTTSAAGGRLIRIRKKTKWIDRRSTRVPHNGKDVYHFGDQPSCALCHVRFRYKQDYEMHKESTLHQNRVRWVEMKDWWRHTGAPAYQRHQEEQWMWYQQHVLPDRAREMQCTREEATRRVRPARMLETPFHHRTIQCPMVKEPIQEPRDQRWPASPKW